MINKIDLPSAQPEVVKQEIEDEIGLDTERLPAGFGQDRASASRTCWRQW